MLFFTLTRHFIGKDMNQVVKEYYLAETEEQFITKILQEKGLLDEEVYTEEDRHYFSSDEAFQSALEGWKDNLQYLLAEHKVDRLDHDFWFENISWRSVAITEEGIALLKMFKIIDAEE